ncbi:hypothetical protein Drorol1_Dr00008026 [Drosera rotundifolia]
MMQGYDTGQLVQEAQTRWLKPAEVFFILKNHESHHITQEAPQKPPSGSLFLFNKRVLRFFRKDGYNWRKKKDGRTVGEAHERLKVGNVEALNCYYAHGEHNPSFQRRSYWMLDPAYEHIVLVHYREIDEGKLSPMSVSELSPGSSLVSPSPSLVSPSPSPSYYTAQNTLSISDVHESYHSLSSPNSLEVSSEMASKHRTESLEKTENSSDSVPTEVTRALRRLELQLSLDADGFNELVPSYNGDEVVDLLKILHNDTEKIQERDTDLQPDHCYSSSPIGVVSTSSYASQHESGGNGFQQQSPLGLAQGVDSRESLSWNDVLGCGSTPLESKEKGRHMIDGMDKLVSDSSSPTVVHENLRLLDIGENSTRKSSMVLPGDGTNITPVYVSGATTRQTSQDFRPMFFDSGQFGMNLEADSSLTIAKQQKFTIREISPDWGFAGEPTKVVIIGSFLCQPSGYTWTCMFGGTEVPAQVIQDGVLCCQAPPQPPGRVTLCITSGNRQSCSEIRDFEYRNNQTSYAQCDRVEVEVAKSTEELLQLARFVHLLLPDISITQKEDVDDLQLDRIKKLKSDEELWDQLIESLLDGSGSASSTTNWLLLELLKDKLCHWLTSKSASVTDDSQCSLSKKEQVIIHMIAGLGYEWALNPVLSVGVGINFRDLNGWTALHWAARFGREKMVAALIASGAAPGALTDPSSQDPRGRTPASIAAANGHQGLAGYLSELALTSHLSSLTLEESELSWGSADLLAETTVNHISKNTVAIAGDQVSLKSTLAAVRNAAQAAARIQSAFRAHSFKKRQQREIEAVPADGDYGFRPNDISAASKLVFRNSHDHTTAALSIQKNYRGWKGRKNFLAFRQKVVKIQANVRGYQVRKKYKVICWAVGVLEKVILRWRRKRLGFRGFKPDAELVTENVEDDDIVRVFRKQEVEVAIDEAVSTVLSMVESPEARQQYQRMHERYQEAKAEHGLVTSDVASNSVADIYSMDDDDDDIFQFPFP